MNKMQKLTCARVLKIIFYLLGFPLLLLLVAKDSMPFFDEDVFSETAVNGITAVFLVWLGILLIQAGLYLVMKKQQALRTIILIVLAITLMLAPVAAMDKKYSAELDEISAKYADKGVTIKDYSLQKQWFNTLSDKKDYTDTLLETLDDFIRIYGLEEYYPHIYRARTQTNNVPYVVANGKKVSVDGQDASEYFDKYVTDSPYVYNPNGLLYDGYIFGVKNAVEQLITYNQYLNKSVYRAIATPATTDDAVGKYVLIDGEYTAFKKTVHTDSLSTYAFYELATLSDTLDKVIAEQETATSGAWYDYTQTDEYKKYKAEQDSYVITDTRLNEILATLFEYIGQSAGINNLISGLNLDSILQLVGGLLAEDETDLTGGAIGTVITQLLYGFNNGSGGATTGLALPAQYLFKNITFNSTTTLKTLLGNLSTDGTQIVPADGSANIPLSDDYNVFVMKYIENAEDPENPILKLSYERYGDVKTDIIVAADADPTQLNQKYFNGQFYTASPITTEYANYVTALEAAYPDTPSTAALVDIIKSLQPALGLVGSLLTGDTVMGLLGGLVEGLDLASILDAILVPGTLDNVIGTLIAGIDLTGVTVEGVQALLDGILGEISFYYHPMLNTCWQSMFLSADDKALVASDGTTIDLSDYATNKYTCEKFGITNGCVLAAGGGLLTGKTLGNGASVEEAFTLDQLYQLQADLEYAPDMYPLLAARRYMIIWAGILAMSIFFTMHYYRKEQKLFYEITTNGGEF